MRQILIILCAFITFQTFGQTQNMILIEGDYKEVHVSGIVKNLYVKSSIHNEKQVSISGPQHVKNLYTTKKKGKKLLIQLNATNDDIVLRLPKQTDIEITPESVAYEGQDYWSNPRSIAIEGFSGAVSVEADGYEVKLLKNSNSMNIVSYMDIEADSIMIMDGQSIIFDSYLGNVDLSIQPPFDALISLEALEGMAKLDSLILLNSTISDLEKIIIGQVGEGKSSILLHSEKGDLVQLQLEALEGQLENLHLLELLDKGLQWELLQNEPNPWRKSTEIVYLVPEDVEVEFTFSGVDGKTLKKESIFAEKGVNTYKLRKKDFDVTGVIYYSIQATGFTTKTRKMVLLE